MEDARAVNECYAERIEVYRRHGRLHEVRVITQGGDVFFLPITSLTRFEHAHEPPEYQFGIHAHRVEEFDSARTD